MRLIAHFMVAAVCTSAAAQEVTQACGPGVYCVEKMLCLGHVASSPIKGVDSKYQAVSVSFRSGKLISKEGFVADFTLWNEQNVGDKPGLTVEQAESMADWTGGTRAPPLKLDGKAVNTWATGMSDGMVLVITSSEPQSNYRLDHLTGTETRHIPSLDPYVLDYDCQANVIDVPSLIVFEKVK